MTSPTPSDDGSSDLSNIIGAGVGGLVGSQGGAAAGAGAAVGAQQAAQSGQDAISTIAGDVSDAADAFGDLNRVLSRWVHWWTTPGNAMRGLGGLLGAILLIVAVAMLVHAVRDSEAGS